MQQKYQYDRVLSGELHPFPGIYEAVSEQILLLIFKARQLYQDPEYRPWFEEQHRVLSALRANTCLLYTSPSPRDFRLEISYAVFCLKKKKNETA